VLDEVMGAAVWQAGYIVAAAKLEVNYQKPVPLNLCISTKGFITRRSGRKIYAHGEIKLPDGTVAVTGRGLYIIAPHLFESSKMFKSN
jgi:acyl-coenzyme A thioesterase PaaI-like protein